MKQILLQNGRPVVEEVPQPVVEAGCILVSTAFSAISSGTELAVVKAVSEPLWRRAVRQPHQVRKVMANVIREGLTKTVQSVQDKLTAPVPLGYSAAGVVIAVGKGVDEFRIGDRVAVAGAQCAFHAQVLCIPSNLAVHVPDNVGLDSAATVALGAIALQGVRRTEPTLGENIAVIGLGVLGQLTCQLLKANGCHVFAIDVEADRVETARQLGASLGVVASEEAVGAVMRSTQGVGLDAVIITAATASNEVISQAFRMCRKKGRVVLVGDVGLNIQRNDMYVKELDFRVSCSYGPGRYDERYENEGIDYPVSYVRWTETRNMFEYIRLIAEAHINISPLLGKQVPLEEASSVYQSLQNASNGLQINLFKYDTLSHAGQSTVVHLKPSPIAPLADKVLNLAVIGAGSFFKSAHLPILRELGKDVSIRAVVTRNGHNAKALAAQSGAEYATTDMEEVLADATIDIVLVTTRHHLHADIARRALLAGKHVFLEKPTALNETELMELEKQCASSNTILYTGHNRRFSPHIKSLAEALKNRTGPMIINYTMNAGYIPSSHWVHGVEGGGRNIGEACHIYDLMLALTDSSVEEIKALSTRAVNGYYRKDDNFVTTLRFKDGSIGNLTYTAMGNASHPKEVMDVFCDGQVYHMHDFISLTRSGLKQPLLKTRSQDKGLAAQWEIFIHSVKEGIWPVSLQTQTEVSRIAFAVQSQLEL